jgi:hypothetical protein
LPRSDNSVPPSNKALLDRKEETAWKLRECLVEDFPRFIWAAPLLLELGTGDAEQSYAWQHRYGFTHNFPGGGNALYAPSLLDLELGQTEPNFWVKT